MPTTPTSCTTIAVPTATQPTAASQPGTGAAAASAPKPAGNPYTNLARACTALAAATAHLPVVSRDSRLRVFSSESVPSITLAKYATHIAARIEQGENGVLLGICLVMRMWRTHGLPPTPDTIHRILLTATVIAMKATYDDFYVNRYMARIGGLGTAKELGELESHMFFNLLAGNATVRQREIRTTLEHGLIPIGRLVQKHQLDDTGAQRRVAYLMADGVAPLPAYDAVVPSTVRGGTSLAQSAQSSTSPLGGFVGCSPIVSTVSPATRPFEVPTTATGFAELPAFSIDGCGTAVPKGAGAFSRTDVSAQSAQSLASMSPKRWAMQRLGGAPGQSVADPQLRNMDRSSSPNRSQYLARSGANLSVTHAAGSAANLVRASKSTVVES